MKEITWDEFQKVDLRVWTITDVQVFPEARNPSYKIWVDFGPELWIKKTSAQVTDLYTKNELMGKQIIGVVNFPVKQIWPFKSEFLLTWFHDSDWVILSSVERKVKNWSKLT